MTVAEYQGTLIYKIDGFVEKLEDQGADFGEIIDALAEYVAIAEDLYGK